MGVLGTFLTANAGKLEPWGVNYIPDWTPDWLLTHPVSGKILLIELDTTSIAVIAFVVATITVVMSATEHHVNAAPPVEGGQRAGDPPAEQPKGE